MRWDLGKRGEEGWMDEWERKEGDEGRGKERARGVGGWLVGGVMMN